MHLVSTFAGRALRAAAADGSSAADSQDFLGLLRSEAAMAEHFYRTTIDGPAPARPRALLPSRWSRVLEGGREGGRGRRESGGV